MRLIDADALETKQKTIYMEFDNVAVPTRVISIADLHLAPTVDAESVRHGKYGFVGMDMMAGSRAFYFGTCSECHERINFEAKHKNYCPNCGAKMDAEENNDGSNSAEY